MDWFYGDRESYPVASSHHQTLLGKTLYEHGNCELIASVASSSSSIQNSSLGPNLLALKHIGEATIPLFASVFLSRGTSTKNTTLQFTKSLFIWYIREDEDIINGFGNLVASLINNTKYFQKSLQEMTTEFESPSFWSFFLSSSSSSSAAVFTSLKTLKIEYCVSKDLIQNMSITFPNLETLELRHVYLLQNESPDSFREFNNNLSSPHLENLTDESLHTILVSGKNKLINLKSFELSSCENITDVSVQDISSILGNLTRLNLSYCTSITDVGVAAIADKLPKLTSLDLTNCHNITDTALASIGENLTHLTSLDFTSCSRITDVGLQSLSSKLANNLTSLKFSDCDSITDQGVESFICKKLIHLTTLELCNCNGISDASLEAVGKNLFNLTYLDIFGHESIFRFTNEGVDALKKALPNLVVKS